MLFWFNHRLLPHMSLLCLNCRLLAVPKCFYSNLDGKYSFDDKEKILKVINESDVDLLSRYNITKARLKKLTKWKTDNGNIKTLSNIEFIENFTEKTAKKLFDSILDGPSNDVKLTNKIKGQILQPLLSDSVRKSCQRVLAVYTSVNSVCWTLIDKSKYEVLDWQYYGIDYPEDKKLQITDIMDTSWHVSNRLPTADVCVMKQELSTLRAAGGDPANPRVLSVNLQRAQLVAMLVALINSSWNSPDGDRNDEDNAKCKLKQKVYFIRPTLPYRLYGTLVGNEKVSTEQTVEMLLQDMNEAPGNSQCWMPEHLKMMFRSQNDLQKDMLGQCLLLSLTFMDLCIYKNKEKIDRLIKRGE